MLWGAPPWPALSWYVLGDPRHFLGGLFEHMDDPRSTLLHIARLLRPGHILLISLPLAGKYAWRKYESYWAQLDAPRHLFLHTEETIRLLARETGFTVREVHYDSTAFQFWGSEQYRRQIPLHDQRSYLVHPILG